MRLLVNLVSQSTKRVFSSTAKLSSVNLGLAVVCLSVLSFAGHSQNNDERTSKEKFAALDSQYQNLSQTVYQHLAQVRQRESDITTTQQLASQVLKLSLGNQGIEAIALIVKHLQIIQNDISGEHTKTFVRYLLNHNEWHSAQTLYQHAKEEADDFTITSLDYLFAKHYFSRQEWETALNLFYQVSQNNSLADKETHYAILTIGILLQSNKRHRDALKYYQSIPRDSHYYHLAQLNSAIINIRQGWWTDAHLILREQLQEDSVKQDKAFTDRLHVILGYSMLRNEFYRDSREVFRNVRLNGEQANRALLGLSLSAANQGDYIGALNALNILKEKEDLDLYVEESHLLLPYIYENLKQDITASAGYTAAIDYYQQRIAQLNSFKTRSIKQTGKLLPIDGSPTVNIEKQTIDYSTLYPEFFFENTRLLADLSNKVSNRALREDIASLQQQYVEMFAHMTSNVLDQQIYYLNSYLNQSRYGLAKLYDEK